MGLDGSAPRPVRKDFVEGFLVAPLVAWHPDRQRISFAGFRREGWSFDAGKGEWSFWTAPADGGVPVRSGYTPEVEQQLSAFDYRMDFTWAPSGRAIYFVGASRDVRSIWRVRVDPATLRWVGGPEQVTTGPDNGARVSVSADGTKLAFSSGTESTRLWSFPFDAVRGTLNGEGQVVTPAGMEALDADLTRDGKKLAYVAWRSGGRAENRELRVKALDTGAETVLVTRGPDTGLHSGLSLPRWAPDGDRLTYVTFRPPGERAWIASITSGQRQELVSPYSSSFHPAANWSPDGAWLVGTCRAPSGEDKPRAICLLPVSAAPRAESQARLVAARPGYNIFQASLSPDGLWISCNAMRDGEMGKVSAIFVVSAAGGQWTQITDGKGWDDKPRWSPDGRTIYYIGRRSGPFEVWGIRFDPARGQAVGRPFQITAFAGTDRQLSSDMNHAEIALGGNRLVLPLVQHASNIWMLENVDR